MWTDCSRALGTAPEAGKDRLYLLDGGKRRCLFGLFFTGRLPKRNPYVTDPSSLGVRRGAIPCSNRLSYGVKPLRISILGIRRLERRRYGCVAHGRASTSHIGRARGHELIRRGRRVTPSTLHSNAGLACARGIRATGAGRAVLCPAAKRGCSRRRAEDCSPYLSVTWRASTSKIGRAWVP